MWKLGRSCLAALRQSRLIETAPYTHHTMKALSSLFSIVLMLGSITIAQADPPPTLLLERRLAKVSTESLEFKTLGERYKKQNNIALAIVFYKRSVNLSEGIRKDIRLLSRSQQQQFTQTVAKDYRVLTDLLLLQGRVLEAQQVLELLKIQEIREFTRNATVKNSNAGIATTAAEDVILKEHGTLIAFGQKVFDCKRSQCAQLTQLNDQLQSLTQQYNQTVQEFSKNLRDRRAQDDAFIDPNQFLPKARAIVEAQPKTVLIYPLVMKDKLWIVWAAKGGVIKSIQLPVSQPQLGEVVVQFRQLLQSPISSPQDLQATSKILYDWLIKPIESELKSNQIQSLVFSLDRVTRYIPMAALYDGKQYLVENYNISTILSADLTDLRDRSSLAGADTATLALGVSEGISDFSPLPNVPAELDAIVRQPPEKKGVYPGLKFLNKAFDFRSFRDNLFGHKIVHIATHAQFTAGRPEESFLLLGTGEKLTISEIQTLQDLGDVQLVVLSACETALGGANQEGTEISGISSYFLNGGAKAVMASLWTVDDGSTSQLMQSFYGHLSTTNAMGNMTKAEALRRSQLELLSSKTIDSKTIGSKKIGMKQVTPDFSHPYFWAPFVITGNGF